MHIAVDLLLVAIVVFCGWQGYRRGIIGGVVAVLFIIISAYGANLLANAYAYEFVDMFQPFISGYFDTVVASEETREVIPEEYQDLNMDDLFKVDPGMESVLSHKVYTELGIYDSRAENLTERYLERRDDTGESFNQAMTRVLVEVFCFLLIYVIAFLLILIAFTVVYNIIHLSFKLPGLKLVDDIGGGVLGVVQGLLLVIMLTWLLGYLGILLPDSLVEDTRVLEFLISRNPATGFIGV